MNAVIKEQYFDEDGYWVVLREAYNPGCHTIVEDSRKEALSRAHDAIRCACPQCRR